MISRTDTYIHEQQIYIIIIFWQIRFECNKRFRYSTSQNYEVFNCLRFLTNNLISLHTTDTNIGLFVMKTDIDWPKTWISIYFQILKLYRYSIKKKFIPKDIFKVKAKAKNKYTLVYKMNHFLKTNVRI